MFFYTDNMMKFAFSQELTDDYEKGYAIMGVPFDSTTSYKSGARYGPKSVREASYNFELYNLNFNKQLTVTNYDIGDVQVNNGNYASTNEMIKDTVMSVLEMGLIPIVIGGEHTVTNGVIDALHSHDEELFCELTIIHFDAHLDMRDEYMGEVYSHASVLRRVHEKNPKQIIQLGIRSAEYDEHEYVKNHDDIQYYTSYQIQDNKNEILDIIDDIDGPIYITVDIDVLDPAYAPSVGTPSPCGITPRDLEDFIKILSKKDVVGLDVVEVSSEGFGDITSINAAKVIYDYLSLQE